MPLLGRIGEAGDALGDLAGLALDFGELARQAVAAFGRFAQRALDLVARGGRLGALGGQLGELRLAGRQASRRLPRRPPRAAASRSAAPAFSAD